MKESGVFRLLVVQKGWPIPDTELLLLSAEL